MALRHGLIHAGFKVLGGTRLHRIVAPWTRGKGAILTFHRVRPAEREPFAPNRGLEITPDFLDELLSFVRKAGYRIIPLDALLPQLRLREPAPPVLVLTFDDGYRDTLTEALPVLEAHAAPFTVFATTGFLDRTARLWWVELEAAIRRRDEIAIELDGVLRTFSTRTIGEKNRAFAAIAHAYLHGRDKGLSDRLSALSRLANVSGHGIADGLCLDWDELHGLAAHPLVTVGCHTQTHPRLATLTPARARDEMEESRAELAGRIGLPVRHVCYPYGNRDAAAAREFGLAQDLGFASGVTTRPGVLLPAHAEHRFALPRISVNGAWQSTSALDVLLSGGAFRLWRAGRGMNVG